MLTLYNRFSRYRANYDEGIRAGLRSVELDPNNAQNRFQLGITYRYAGDFDQARLAYLNPVDSRPTSLAYYTQLGAIEISRGDHESALSYLRTAEQLPVGSDVAAWRYSQLAFAYAQLDQDEAVERVIESIRDLDDEDQGHPLEAMIALAQRDSDEAYKRLQAATLDENRIILILAELKANPYSDAILNELRFQELLNALTLL